MLSPRLLRNVISMITDMDSDGRSLSGEAPTARLHNMGLGSLAALELTRQTVPSLQRQEMFCFLLSL